MTFSDSSPVPLLPPRPGTRIDNDSLRLVDVLKESTSGAVYLAEHIGLSLCKSYVVKCFLHPHSSTALQQQIQRKAYLHRLASDHENVITLHRVIEEPNCTYIVMDYAPDHDLFHQILQGRYLGKDNLIMNVFFQIIDAVAHLHERGIYHCDLKPENIFCFDHGSRVGISNFGMATSDKMSKEFWTGSGYRSPECQDGNFSPEGAYSPMHNDIWSLGIILLNLVTGRHPWKSATIWDPMFKAYSRDPQSFLPTVLPISDKVNTILVRMLAVDYRRRMTIPELRVALRDVNTFYCKDVIFEGHIALCPWAAGMVIDNDLSQTKSSPVKLQVAEPKPNWDEFSRPYIREVFDSPMPPPSSDQQRDSDCFDGLNPESDQISSPESGLRNRRPYKGYDVEECMTDSSSKRVEDQPSPNDSGIFIDMFSDKEEMRIRGGKDSSELLVSTDHVVLASSQPFRQPVLPVHIGDVVTGLDNKATWKWWERALCKFTMYEELKNAEYEELSLAISLANSPQIPQTSPAHKSSSYEKVYERLQAEWTSIGTWLIGLAAVNIAIFAIPPLSSDIATTPHTLSCITLSSSLFPINVCVRSVAGVSAATTALGLIWDVYFWVSYCGRDVETFLNRIHPSPSDYSPSSPPSTPNSAPPSSSSSSSSSPSLSQSPSLSSGTSAFQHSPTSISIPPSALPQSIRHWAYFSLSARLPALYTLLSIFSLVAFLFIVAHEAIPPAVLWVLCAPIPIAVCHWVCFYYLPSLVQSFAKMVMPVMGKWVRSIVKEVGKGIITGLHSLRTGGHAAAAGEGRRDTTATLPMGSITRGNP